VGLVGFPKAVLSDGNLEDPLVSVSDLVDGTIGA
jgi:hypothetical protein